MPPQRIQEITGHIQSQLQPRNVAVTILRAGKSDNGWLYPPAVLEQAAPLFEGATAFCDHAKTHRSIRDIVGSYHDVRVHDETLTAVMRLLDGDIGQLVTSVLEDYAAGIQTPHIGLSCDIMADVTPGTHTIERITHVNSVDIVFRPSAGGTLDRLLEQQQEENTMPEPPVTPPTVTPPAATSVPISEAATIAASAQAAADAEAIRQTRLALSGDLLTSRLQASNLPETARHHIAESFVGRIYDAPELDTAITSMRTLVGSLTAGDTIQNSGAPRGQVGAGKHDRIQNAVDLLFENPLTDAQRQSTPRPHGLLELFRAAGFVDKFGWERNTRIQEADEVTTSIMAGIVGTSMAKRLLKDFADQPKWWKPIVVETSISNVKAQTRVKLNDFAVLPTVAEDGLFVNLAWDDVSETITPLKKGSAVHVTLETIINDDLRAVLSIPKKLARAAGVTINELISALFTDTSGTGPALVDTYHIFDNSHHQSNLGATALDATTLTAGLVALSKMTDTASKRMGLVGKWLLIPPDLQYTAWTLAYSQLKPGMADNDANPLQGRFTPIVVPQFTDTDNWYLLADPGQVELIEVCYLNGQDAPELLVQDDPLNGSMFTYDAITYKVRWFLGAGWVDYRGAYGAVVT